MVVFVFLELTPVYCSVGPTLRLGSVMRSFHLSHYRHLFLLFSPHFLLPCLFVCLIFFLRNLFPLHFTLVLHFHVCEAMPVLRSFLDVSSLSQREVRFGVVPLPGTRHNVGWSVHWASGCGWQRHRPHRTKKMKKQKNESHFDLQKQQPDASVHIYTVRETHTHGQTNKLTRQASDPLL